MNFKITFSPDNTCIRCLILLSAFAFEYDIRNIQIHKHVQKEVLMKVNDLLLIRMREMMCEECGDNLNLSLVNRIELSTNIREVSMFPEKAPT